VSYDAKRLYELLPAIYRIRDAEQGEPLKALFAVLAEQMGVLEEDLAQLYDDQFIETCAPWVVPYIGDLVGNNPLFDIGRPLRADVARTIHYRRRKGTLHALEEMARDVTGWGCRAVEFFRLLDWNQNLNHLRPDNLGCANVRDINTMDLVDTAFDTSSHTVDVRPIGQAEGWHNIKNIGFFLWRLRSYPIDDVPARPVDPAGDYRYHFSVLGSPAPLFHHAQAVDETTGRTEEANIPAPIRPLALHRDLEKSLHEMSVASIYYGQDFQIKVRKGVDSVTPKVVCVDLSTWAQPSESGVVGLDTKLGRLALAADLAGPVIVSHHYGFSGDVGGGQYDRLDTLASQADRELILVAQDTTGISADGALAVVKTIEDAISEWNKAENPCCIIRILDNGAYVYESDKDLGIALPAPQYRVEADGKKVKLKGDLFIEAANGFRPCLRLSAPPASPPQPPVPAPRINVTAAGDGAALTINGLLVEGGKPSVGGVLVAAGELKLTLDHCTFVPGRALSFDDGAPAEPEKPSLEVSGSGTDVTIRHSIVGPLRVDVDNTLTVEESIIDAPEGSAGRVLAIAAIDGSGPGPQTTLVRTTVLGGIYVKELALASEVIFAGVVTSDRLQSGCVRFSFVPDGSQTPRRYRCQPTLAKEQAVEKALEAAERGERAPLSEEDKQTIRDGISVWLKPAFTSVRYGHPAYCQLSYYCPEQIRTGAEDGSEMGAFCTLRNPQREANLRIRLQEYLPVGLTPGLIYVT
jgi:hypothetical protein